MFQDHNIAIENVRANHRVAANAQRKCVPIFQHVCRARVERHVAFDALLRQCRHPGRNLTVNWNVRNADLHGRSDQRSSFARVAVKKAFALQRRNVLHHRSLTREPEMILNFACARCESFFALLVLNKIQHVLLPFGQHEGIIFQAAGSRKFK